MRGRWSPQAIGLVVLAFVVLAISVALTAMPRDEQTAVPMVRHPGSDAVRPLSSVLQPARLPARVRAVIIRDEAAASYYTRAAVLDTIIAHWRRALSEVGADVIVARSGDQPAVRAADVLVVPSSPCLMLATRAAIDAAASRGQGLILSGMVGTHDAGCREIGLGLLTSRTGASRIEHVERRAMAYVTVPAGTPLSIGIPPGARLDVNPARPLALRHRSRAAYYSDYLLVPQPAGEQPLLDGALVATNAGRARIVYWGFEPRDVVRSPWNQTLTALLLRNSVAWAARIPLGEVEPWPNGRRAAAVLAQDVESRFEYARHALDSLRAAGVRSTFFLTSDLALRRRGLTRDIAESGEVATHSENHEPLAGLAKEAQRARLERTRADLERLIDQPVRGMRPPREEFDHATMAAWLEAGGRYLFGANDSRAAAPELFAIDGDTLVLFGRVAHDDFSAIGPRGTRDPSELADVLLADFRKVRALGGLYLLSYHSQLMSRAELVPSLARLARAIAADDEVWLTTAGEVAAWWRARAGVEVSVHLRSPDALVVTIRNRGGEAVDGATIRVVLGDARRVVRANVPLLHVEPGVVRFRAPPLGPGTATAVDLVMAPAG